MYGRASEYTLYIDKDALIKGLFVVKYIPKRTIMYGQILLIKVE